MDLVYFEVICYDIIQYDIIILENWNQSSLFVLQVLIYVEKEHEGGKESTSREEMPEVMTVIEVEQNTLFVGTTGDGGRIVLFLWSLCEEIDRNKD